MDGLAEVIGHTDMGVGHSCREICSSAETMTCCSRFFFKEAEGIGARASIRRADEGCGALATMDGEGARAVREPVLLGSAEAGL